MRVTARPPSLLIQALLIGLACVAAIGVSACTVARALERVPGTDLSTVKVGATRAQVETVLGSPQREWTTRVGVRYCLYRYDAGIEPSPLNAAGAVFMNIGTLGLIEGIVLIEPNSKAFRGPHKHPLMAVSYDSMGVVLGVFDDVGQFTAFPDDGRPPVAADAGAAAR